MKKTTLFLLILVFLSVMLITSACGNGDSPAGNEKTAGGETINPCALITRTQAESIFGESFKNPVDKSPEKNPLGQKVCFFDTTDEGSFTYLQISIIKSGSAGNIFRETRKNFQDVREVSGVGDDAFWATLGLHILNKDTYINIACGNSSKLENLDKAKKIAGIVLGNL